MRTIVSLFAALILGGMGCGDNGVTPDAAGGAACSDGIDNDGDGQTDFPDDLGCSDANDSTEDSSAAPACDDDRDNDGDGKTDYPADPGCIAPQQEDEDDDCPAGPGCPQCANGIDDDANGSLDYPDDPGCTAASDPFELVANPVACGAGLTIKQLPASGMDSGTLDTTSTSMIMTTCGGGNGSPAIAYQISLTQPKVIVATTDGSAFDSVLDLRGTACATPASHLACNDDIDGGNSASALTRSLPAGNYYLIVQGHDASESGAYMLDVKLFTGEGENCTDTSQCGPGLVCRTPLGGTQMKCSQPVCNDTIDEDGDGDGAGYPIDPGCSTPADNDEADDCPNGINCPACSNDVDDDNDSMTDYPLDTSCSAASGTSEACTGEDDPIVMISAGTTMGNLAGTSDDHTPSCGSDGDGDLLFTLRLPTLRSLVIDTNSAAPPDTVLSLLASTCQEPSLACDDEGGTLTGASQLSLTNVAAGNYVVAVDMYFGELPGPFNLNVAGVISPGGSCEPSLTLGGALVCPVTNPCEGVAGMMKCRPSACGDGISNNDGDALIDFPADPGCTSLEDLDEADTCPGVGPGCPECADGADNDTDGSTDFPADSNCTSPSSASESCVTTDGVRALTTATVTDTTTGAADDLMPACGSTNNTAPDHTYRLDLPALATLSIVNTNSYDAVVALYNATCSGTALQCNDTPEDITLTNVAAGTYYYVTDGYSSAAGAYTLTVSGTIQNNTSCESALAQAGALTCGAGYTCKGTAGSRTCQRAQCNDGINNMDGDAIADYPNDPGCANSSDDDETDTCPGGATCPVCSDGVDNDGDNLTDYPNDPSCVAAGATSEACLAADGVSPLILPMTAGTTVGAVNDSSPACGSSSNTAPDRMYALVVPQLTSLSITNVNPFDAVVALYNSTCAGTALQCRDTPEDLALGALAAGTYYYLIDGYGSGSGTYTINVSGTIAAGASCESMLATSGALTCSSGYACSGTIGARTCQVSVCNDGLDNDSDGDFDYPFDPGCATASDSDETDPAVAPVCANTTDDDTDSSIDWPADYGCVAASGTSEVFCAVEVNPTSLITATPVTGTTTGMASNFTGASCQTNGSGEDVAYALSLPVPVESLVLDLGLSGFDTIVTLRDPQCAMELGCDDDSGSASGGRSKLTTGNLPAGNYAIVIDGWSGADGAYSMAVRGTVASGTACSSPLFAAGVLACPMSTTCTGTPLRCQ